MASQEKYNQIHELERRSKKLKGKNRIAMIGQVDFPAANNLTRGGMNIKHKTQHLAIHDPEFPMVFDGKENVSGENSSYFNKAKKNWKVIDIIKKYNELMNGNSYITLYFLHCDEDNSYKLIERKEVENLPENFGFRYKNDYLDSLEIGETIPQGTVMQSSRSYDDDDNTSVGVNARILYAAHPAVQDDAIICSESFAKRMIATNVKSISIPINEDTILLNLYGKDGEYKPLPDIGEKCNGIVAASRIVKEARSFSDLRDSSLNAPHGYGDTRFFGTGTIVDINVYCNRHDLKRTKTNSQLLRYYHDACWFYTKVYKRCNEIINKSGSRDIDREINRWFRLAKNYLDRSAQWAFNDSVFTNMYVEIIVAKDEPITVGRKITGRHGNKTVTCMIMKDEDMPYLTREVTIDKYGVKHAAGIRERVDLITNPLAIVNRTIAMALIEGSLTFILDITRKHAATLDTLEEKADWIFDILGRLNKKECDEFKAIYKKLSPKRQKRFIDDCISLNPDGTLRTDNGMYVRFESFSNETNCRDAIINVYQTYPDIFKPYNVFMPKPKWGRDIFVTEDYVGYQYIMMLKQSGEKGFSVRSAGSISDESLPEKSHDSKISKLLHSNKPIRFGEWTNALTLNLSNCGDDVA